MATFSQHHVDGLDLALTPLQYMLKCFPLTKDQEQRYAAPAVKRISATGRGRAGLLYLHCLTLCAAHMAGNTQDKSQAMCHVVEVLQKAMNCIVAAQTGAHIVAPVESKLRYKWKSMVCP